MGTTATGRAKEVAKELGVDLEAIEGSGKDGRVTVTDVQAAAAAIATGIPADFSERQQALWAEVVEYLEEHGLWKPLFGPLLERYIRKLFRAEDARDRAEAEPEVTGSTGQLVANPFFRVEREAEADAHKYAEALLLTPEMLQRHLKGEEEEDEGLGF